jgi:hypothetical protein
MKSFIKNFDANGLTIKTRNMADEPEVGEKDTGAVDKMAKRAASKEIKS